MFHLPSEQRSFLKFPSLIYRAETIRICMTAFISLLHIESVRDGARSDVVSVSIHVFGLALCDISDSLRQQVWQFIHVLNLHA